jgi:molybdopterin/thiamine biosynthesis adenylyltransferase
MERPRIKDGHAALLLPDGAVWIGMQVPGVATELADERGVAWSVCSRMDGTRPREALVAEVTADHPDTDAAEVGEIVDFLIASGWVQDAAAAVPPTLTTREAERYSRHIGFLDTVNLRATTNGYELQARLKASRVAVLGLGGVGSAVAANLVASGVGHVHCVDHDVVELSNLNRQLLYTEADIGRGKAGACLQHLRARNSDVEVTGSERRLDGPEDVAVAAAGRDAIVLCADQPADQIETWVNTAAYDLGVPWLTAGYAGPKFALSCFIPGQTACHACLTAAAAELRSAQGHVPVASQPAAPSLSAVSAASAQIAGHYLAAETIRLLLGMPVQTAGRELHRFMIDYDEQYYLDAKPRADCPFGCGSLPR